MKNNLLILTGLVLTIVLILNINLVFASSVIQCNPTIKLVSQDPSPAVPNDYVKVLFEVTDLGNCDGFAVKLNPKYPFSLDPDTNAVQTIESNPSALDYKDVWTVPYKIRIDSAAFDGDYSLKLQYHEGSDENFNSYAEKSFNMSIQDSRTDFDAVIQESTSSQVSIAIANTGKYTANSVIVRIPEQNDFVAVGTDGQMVGNLDSGDYTIVGFSISSKRAAGAYQNASRGLRMVNNSSPSQSELKFDVYYTDNIGQRRIVNMNLPLIESAGNFSQSTGNFSSRRTAPSTSPWYLSWIFWVIIAILIAVYILYKKNPRRFKNLLKRKGSANDPSSDKIPEWIRNAKEKEKKR
jgi:hypothetical protein